MMYIVFMSAAVYLLHEFEIIVAFQTRSLIEFLQFHPVLILRGEVWRLITWIFIPLNNNIFFTAIMLYFYYFVGSTLEREWGTAKFTVYYIFAILANLAYGFIITFVFRVVPYIVPNYINLSMFFAFAAYFPDFQIRLFFIIPIKVKWMALINAGFFALSIIMSLINNNVFMALLPIVALLNFFIFCGEKVLSYLRPHRSRVSPRTISFKQAARRAKRSQEKKPYRHKCAVCGKTDTDYPDMEFRYCSRCDGYHCYCIDHINNHIHFQ